MILIVDDHPSNLRLLSDLLESRGYLAVATRNGEEALDEVARALERHTLPELVLLDVQMSGLSGLEVLGRWRREAGTRDLKVVAVTAFAMQGDRNRFLAEGFDDYLPKPFSATALINLLERHLPRPTTQASCEVE